MHANVTERKGIKVSEVLNAEMDVVQMEALKFHVEHSVSTNDYFAREKCSFGAVRYDL